jgi:uncharacterized protein
MKALAVAAGIVFWTLVLGTAWLAFFPGSDSGGPVAILQIQPATAPGADMPAAAPEGAPPPEASESPAQATEEGMQLPPGFGVGPSGPPQAPIVEAPGPGQGPTLLPIAPGGQLDTPAAPPSAPDDAAPPDADQQGSAPAATPEMQQTALETPASPPADVSAPPAVPETETGSIVLPPVPVAELVEESQYGPLPKVATDGRRPVEVYARPSRYAAVSAAGGPPRIAILITGLGLPASPPGDVLKGLPAPMSVAYGAYGRNLQDGVTRARDSGHEVLLQIPLEPSNYPTEDPGPHTLLTTLPPEENMKRLQWLMSRYTGYVGVTNHMGAKFEAAPDSLQPVLEELKRRGLLYVDDGSVQGSMAGQIAGAIGLDYSVVSIQIDAGNVAKQLAQLETAARERGAAIGVAKATAVTIKQLVDWANKLEAKGFVLVPVSAAVRSQRQS